MNISLPSLMLLFFVALADLLILYFYSKVCDIGGNMYVFYIFRLIFAIKYNYVAFILGNT